MVTDIFLKLVLKYSSNKDIANELWLELYKNYSEPGRHYHTMTHIENMLSDLQTVRQQISDWDTVLASVFYHDIIYKSTSGSNEEDSARIASERLAQISFPEEKIEKCIQLILSTKQHKLSADRDTNLLIDADLAALGSQPDEYQLYCENIRKEYSVYPDFVYNPGRRKVLQHFLEMDSIFKTQQFAERLEKQARLNIAAEMVELK